MIFRRVLDDQSAVRVRNAAQLVNLSGCPVQVRDDDQPHFRVDLKGFFQRFRIHVPGIGFGVNIDRLSAFIRHRIDSRVKGHVTAEDLLPLQSAVSDLRLAVQSLPGQFYGQVQRRCPGRKSNRVSAADLFRDQALHFVDVFTDRADPVGPNRFVDPFLLLTVHRRRSKPDFLFKRQ